MLSEGEILGRIFPGKELKPAAAVAAHRVLEWCRENPYLLPPPTEKVGGDLLSIIGDVVEEMYGRPLKWYLRRDRRRDVLDVRHRVLYLYRKLSGKSILKISEEFGYNHSTLINAFKKVEWNCKTDDDYGMEYEEMKERVITRCKN